MSAYEVEQPILNSPFEEPAEHWWIEDGQTPEARGRRAGGPVTSTATRRRREPEAGQPARGDWEELELVNLIRERLDTVARGRLSRHKPDDARPASGTGAATAGSSDSSSPRSRPPRRSSSSTRRVPICSRVSTSRRRIVPEGVDAFRRYACKMATGSGKTTVMAMLAAWSILNKVDARGDARFSDVVLVVCPNVTIRERLSELDPNRDEASIYRTRDLVPPHLMPSLRRGRVLVKNWHDFERKGMSAGAKVQKNGVPELVRQTVKIGAKTTSGRAGRYMTEKALEIALIDGARILEDRRPKKPRLCSRRPGTSRAIRS